MKNTVIYALGSVLSAAAPTWQSATDPTEFGVCRSKPNLPDQTDSNAALLSYLTNQLGSAHE